MSFYTRKVACLVVVVVCVALFAARQSAAQGVAADAKAAVTAEAEKAVETETGTGQPNPLAVDPDLAIWTFVVFAVLFGLLSVFAWPQISAALEERERKITDNIAAAEAQHEAAKRLLAEHEAKLAAAAGEVGAMLEEARRDADHTRRQIEADGHKAAKDELDRAVREIGRARDAAIQDLAVTSANVAIDLARGVVRSEISADRQKQIVREALGKLGAATPSKN